MQLFTTSLDLVGAGIYAIEITAPLVIEGIVFGYLGYVFEGEWGPVGVVGTPSGTNDFLSMYFPKGSPRNSSGYYGIMGRSGAVRPVRIAGVGAVAASRTITATGGSIVVTLLYVGTVGNLVTVQVLDASNGVATSCNLLITLADAHGNFTSDLVENVPENGPAPSLTGFALVGSITYTGTITARPASEGAGVLCTGGTNGATVVGSDYQNGLNLLLSRKDVYYIACGEAASSGIRTTNRAALMAQAIAKKDRLALIQGEMSQTWTTAQTDVLTYQTDRVVYFGCGILVADDNKVNQPSPAATMAGMALTQLDVSQSHAWQDSQVTDLYSYVQGIYGNIDVTDDSVNRVATQLGICLPITLEDGSHAFNHDRTTSPNVNTRFATTRRTKDFLARSLVSGTRSFANASQNRAKQLALLGVSVKFLGDQETAERITDYDADIDSVNTSSTIAIGDFYVKIDAVIPSVMEKIGFLLNAGPTVTIVER